MTGKAHFAVFFACFALMNASLNAAQTNIAIAANFTAAAKEIAAAFTAKTGHIAVLSFGASGILYTQITQDAPFDILLSADDTRPKKLVEDGLGIKESEFTYAIGKLVLWSKNPDLVKGEDTLKTITFSKIAIANPASAPYGAAALETLKNLNLGEVLGPKIVQGNSIAQTFEFIETANAELGFIAVSQLTGNTSGSRWLVPQNLYSPIRQDAVLLTTGAHNEAALAFLAFLKSSEAHDIAEKFGYDAAK